MAKCPYKNQFFWSSESNPAKIIAISTLLQSIMKKFMISPYSPIPYWFKLVSTIFYQIFIFHQLIALQNWKMFFILSKKLFLFLRYLIFCIFVLPLFFPVSHCFRDWSKKNLKIHDFINCLNKKLIANFVWYLEKEIRCDHQRYK